MNFRNGSPQSGRSKRHGVKNNINLSNNQSASMSISDSAARQFKAPPVITALQGIPSPPNIGAKPLSLHRPKQYPIETPPPLCTTKQVGIDHGICTKKGSGRSQTSISFFFCAALLAPSTKASNSPLISHIPRKMLPSSEISSQGAAYSMTLPLSRTRTLS